MRKLTTVIATGLAVTAAAFGAGHYTTTAAHNPAACHPAGGGTITAGHAQFTPDGSVWQCTQNGRLARTWTATLASRDSSAVTPWGRVVAGCKKDRDCVRTPAVIRHADGISAHAPSWTRYGDTTVTWVRGPHGTVRTYTS